MRAFLLATAAVLTAATGAQAAPITTDFTYSFVGAGTTVNPGAFSPTTISPPSGNIYTVPTFTASAGPATATIGPATLATNAQVVQTSGGLGIRSDGFSRVFGVTVTGPTQNEIAGTLGGAVVDGVGSAISGTNTTTAERLSLTFSETEPNILNSRLTSVTFDNTLNFGAGNDFAIFKNNVLVGNFNLPGIFGANTFTLPTPLAIGNGDTITFVPLVNGPNLNFFSVSGANVQAEVIPEPATLAVFGGLALAGALGYRRRKATASV